MKKDLLTPERNKKSRGGFWLIQPFPPLLPFSLTYLPVPERES